MDFSTKKINYVYVFNLQRYDSTLQKKFFSYTFFWKKGVNILAKKNKTHIRFKKKTKFFFISKKCLFNTCGKVHLIFFIILYEELN